MQATVFDRTCALELLQSIHPFLEERGFSKHSCASLPDTSYNRPFLRVWDENSGSHPDLSKRILARLPREQLGSRQSREKALTTHADYQRWEPTPFISFTPSISALQEFLSRRKWKSFSRRLTVINPNVRTAKGLPMLEMESELRYYEVPDPYRREYLYYKDEYLCLWEITPDEVVGHWDWDNLIENEHWYEEEILPAFENHDEEFQRRNQSEAIFDVSTLQTALPNMPLVSMDGDELNGSELDYLYETDSSLNRDWFSSSEEDWQSEEEFYPDTDDEVEESNAIDDAYKILEGDW